MRKQWLFVLLCFLALPSCAQPQTQTAPEATGTVSGHVYCADTSEPARFATIMLQSAPHKDVAADSGQHISAMQAAPASVRTGLDGSFRFPKVRPGNYFLIAEYAGYVSPLAKLSADQIRSSAPADIEKIEKLLDKVTVAAGKEAAADVELERGASIAGTVRFDDGSPANEVQVLIYRQQKDGTLTSISLTNQIQSAFAAKPEGMQTNDHGYYRVSGLPAGKYIVETTFPTDTSSFGGLFGDPAISSIFSSDANALSVYSGNVFRRKDAKAFELVAGEERDGNDITIPLLGLHSVGGSVLALSDGHPINHGQLELLYADDKTRARKIGIDRDGRFGFFYIPEGEYILRVEDPGDSVEQLVHDSAYNSHVDDKIIHGYGAISQNISLHEDQTSLIINVPEKASVQKQ